MKTKTKQVSANVIFIGLIAIALYLISFGAFVFVVTSYYLGNLEGELFAITISSIIFITMPITNKMLDYYLDEKHRLIEIPDYPY